MSEHHVITGPATDVQPAAGREVMPVPEQTGDQIYEACLQRLPLQRKLAVGAVDDPLEREADEVAGRVMRMPEPAFIQRKCAHCAEEDKAQRKPFASFIQRKETGDAVAGGEVTSGIDATRGGGSSLPDTTRRFMESRMDADFSAVRVHTGDYAAKLSQELNAQAFTVGNDVYFNAGKFSPESPDGKQLLAHELTHTLQQGFGSSETAPVIQRVPFSPWPGQAGTDVAATYTSAGDVISERVQRTGDPHFSPPMPSLLEFNPGTRVLRSTMQINFTPAADAANRLTTEQFNALKQRILQIGNSRLNGWVHIHAGSEAACPANCRDQDITVEIVAGEGTGANATNVVLGRSFERENAGNLGNSSSDWTLWHEMGHIVLGAADEYAEAGRPDEHVNESDYSIMASSSSYGRMGMMHARHFSHLAAWLNRKYPGCHFETVANDRPLVIDWDPSVFIGGFGGAGFGLFYSAGVDMGIPLDRLRRLSVILGLRFNFTMQSDTPATLALLAGFRAGLRYRAPGAVSFQSTVFAEGGGLGFTDLRAGRPGAAPYAEGGASLGVSLLPLDLRVEAAAGGRTAMLPPLPGAGAGAGERTEFQPYYRIGLMIGGTF